MSITFNEKAVAVFNNAITIAQELGHTYVGSEHLFLSIAEDKDSQASVILEKYGADCEKIRDFILEYSGSADKSGVTASDVTPRLKKLLKKALTFANCRNASAVETYDILFAICEESESVASKCLESIGINTEDILANDFKMIKLKDKIYDLIENTEGGLTAIIHEGIESVEEYPFMPDLFEFNSRVTYVHVPNSLVKAFVYFKRHFPRLKTISGNADNHNLKKFSISPDGIWGNSEDSWESIPCFAKNEDGTLTLDVPDGVSDMSNVGNWAIFENVTVINIPASVQNIGTPISYYFSNLLEFHVHPDSKYLTVEDGVLFSKDKKKLIKYPRGRSGENYRIPDGVEEICSGCFASVGELKNVYIGRDVKKLGACSIAQDMYFCLDKIYIPPTVTEFEGEIFDVGADDGGVYYPISIVGGVRGSAIDYYCNKRGIDFIEVFEDGVDDFYAASVEELRIRAENQTDGETEFFVDESEKGYQMKFADGTLEIFVPENVSASEITISSTKVKIHKNRRKMVKNLVIGARITGIDGLAFDDYENLQSVFIGADVNNVSPLAFSGNNGFDSYGCKQLSVIEVDKSNRHYKASCGMLYSYDMQTLVKYCPAKPDLYHEIDCRVRYIGEYAFEYAKCLQCLRIGDGVVSVGHLAFLNVNSLRHVYVSENVKNWPETFPFAELFGYERPYRIRGLVIGGPRGSFIQKYCSDDGARFIVIEKDRMEDFLRTPLPTISGWDDVSDPYIAEALKYMIVDKNGAMVQSGETGEEFVIPEGVSSTYNRIDLSTCKEVVIPATLTSILAQGFDGPAPSLEKFEVAANNPKYKSVDGHLYDKSGALLVYAPAAAGNGIIPDGTVAILSSAFSLLEEPFDNVYISSTVRLLEYQGIKSKWFRYAEVSCDNPEFKSIEGSIFSKDGKKLIFARHSTDCYTVPERTEEIGNWAFEDLSGTLIIPESVTSISEYNDIPSSIKTVRVVGGSYAEQYAKQNCCYGTTVEIITNGNIEKWSPPKSAKGTVTSTDWLSLPF